MSIAFFDFDKTVIATNSAAAWVRSELRCGFITQWQALKAGAAVVLYHMGVRSVGGALAEMIRALAGSREEDVRARTCVFYESIVRGAVRPGALEAIARHHAEHEKVVLLTSMSNYVAELVSADLGLDGYLCNRLEVDASGCHTGRPVGALCFGPGKLVHARAYAEERGVRLRDCAFYTDSNSDLPMLEAVGRPVAVNPDPKLRHTALARGWPVVDWGQPAAIVARLAV